MNTYRAISPFLPFPTPSMPSGVPSMPGIPAPGVGPGVGLPPGITPPPPQLLGTFQQLSQSPSQVQSFVSQYPSPQGVTTFAAGCQNRWTIIVTRTFNVFLMYVTSTNPFGFTQGFIFPTYSFGSFPSSVILWYSCF
ncbi:hypothetical protein D3C76_835280 [compost metagenome]